MRPIHVFAEDPPDAFLSKGRILQVAVDFPEQRGERCVKGAVWLAFAINDEGKADGVSIVKSYPKGHFDVAALSALDKWIFPLDDNSGVSVERSVVLPFVFHPPCEMPVSNQLSGRDVLHVPALHQKAHPNVAHDDVPMMLELEVVNEVPPMYPSAALRACEGGTVYLEFLVDELGAPQEIEVIAADGHSSLKKAAKNALINWRFLPYDLEGGPALSRAVLPFQFTMSQFCE